MQQERTLLTLHSKKVLHRISAKTAFCVLEDFFKFNRSIVQNLDAVGT